MRNAILFWLTAIGADVLETLLHFIHEPVGSTQVAIRVVIYAALSALVIQLRNGRNRVRVTLTALLGGLGLFSLIGLEIIAALNSGAEMPTDAWGFTFLAVRTLHVVAVIAALVAMFQPASNRFFRAELH